MSSLWKKFGVVLTGGARNWPLWLRIHGGTFGTCLHCGNEISGRRLEAVPWAPLCIMCREAADFGQDGVVETIALTFSDAA